MKIGINIRDFGIDISDILPGATLWVRGRDGEISGIASATPHNSWRGASFIEESLKKQLEFRAKEAVLVITQEIAKVNLTLIDFNTPETT